MGPERTHRQWNSDPASGLFNLAALAKFEQPQPGQLANFAVSHGAARHSALRWSSLAMLLASLSTSAGWGIGITQTGSFSAGLDNRRSRSLLASTAGSAPPDFARLVKEDPVQADRMLADADASGSGPASRPVLSTEGLETVLSYRGRPTVVLFALPVCKTCKNVAARMEPMVAAIGGHFFTVYKNAATSKAFEVHRIMKAPTVSVYDGDGTIIDRSVYTVKDLPMFEQVLRKVTR